MKWLRSLDPQLPREVWLLQLGGVMNSFGNGLILPFLVIYLHDVRGFGLGVSGLVVAVSAAGQLTAGVAAFLAYVGVLALVPDPGVPAAEQAATPASYRAVLRDRLFVRLWALNFLFVTASYSLFNLVPPFARDHAHLSERQIGVVFFVNTGLNVLAQLPISRAIEGRRRLRALALMPLLWAGSWLMVESGGYWLPGTAAFAGITVALAIFGVGECFHGPAHQALVAEIAPDHLRGRYFGMHSLSWGLAGSVGPAAGGFLTRRESAVE